MERSDVFSPSHNSRLKETPCPTRLFKLVGLQLHFLKTPPFSFIPKAGWKWRPACKGTTFIHLQHCDHSQKHERMGREFKHETEFDQAFIFTERMKRQLKRKDRKGLMGSRIWRISSVKRYEILVFQYSSRISTNALNLNLHFKQMVLFHSKSKFLFPRVVWWSELYCGYLNGLVFHARDKVLSLVFLVAPSIWTPSV